MNDKIFYNIIWVAATDYWVDKAEQVYIRTEIILDLQDYQDELKEYNNIYACQIIENINTYAGKQSLYVEYKHEFGSDIINVTDFEFFEPDNITDAILDKLNDMRKLAE